MSMKPSTRIVKFMDPDSGVHALGWGPMSPQREIVLIEYFLLYNYSCAKIKSYTVITLDSCH